MQQIVNQKDVQLAEKANALLELAECALKADLDSAQLFTEQGFQLYEILGYEWGIARCYYIRGKVDEINGSYFESELKYSMAMDYYQKVNKDELYLKICNSRAFIHEIEANYDKALELYMTGLNSAVEQGDLTFEAGFRNNIATVLMKSTRIREALPYLFRAASVFEELDRRKYSIVLGNIVIAYIDLELYDSAMVYLDIAGEIALKNSDFYNLILTERSKGDILLGQGNPPASLHHYKASLEYAEMLDSLHPEKLIKNGWSRQFYGHALMRANDYTNSVSNLREAKLIGDRLKSYPLISESAIDLANIYDSLGFLDSTLYYYRQSKEAHEIMLLERNNTRIDSVSFQYQTKLQQLKHNSEVKLISLEKRRRELVIFILIGITTSLVALFYSIWRNQKSRIKIVEREQQILEMESGRTILALDRKKRELTSTLLSLSEKNELLASIISRLQKLADDKGPVSNSEVLQLISTINTKTDKTFWEKFELSFLEVHPKFYESLNKTYPDLTSNEKRLCVFLYLNLSTKEISSITFQSVQSIKIARYRLRKKMGLERGSSIIQSLRSLN